MNFEERTRNIADWINPTDGFLSLFKAPAGLDDHVLRAELLGLVEAINTASPLAPNEDAFKGFLSRLAKEVRASARTRSWPLQSEFIAAIDAVRRRPVQPHHAHGDGSHDDKLLELQVTHAADWFRNHGSLPNWWNTREVCEAMIDRGLVSYEELKAAHAAVPMREDAGRFVDAEMKRMSPGRSQP